MFDKNLQLLNFFSTHTLKHTHTHTHIDFALAVNNACTPAMCGFLTFTAIIHTLALNLRSSSTTSINFAVLKLTCCCVSLQRHVFGQANAEVGASPVETPMFAACPSKHLLAYAQAGTDSTISVISSSTLQTHCVIKVRLLLLCPTLKSQSHMCKSCTLCLSSSQC